MIHIAKTIPAGTLIIWIKIKIQTKTLHLHLGIKSDTAPSIPATAPLAPIKGIKLSGSTFLELKKL